MIRPDAYGGPLEDTLDMREPMAYFVKLALGQIAAGKSLEADRNFASALRYVNGDAAARARILYEQARAWVGDDALWPAQQNLGEAARLLVESGKKPRLLRKVEKLGQQTEADLAIRARTQWPISPALRDSLIDAAAEQSAPAEPAELL